MATSREQGELQDWHETRSIGRAVIMGLFVGSFITVIMLAVLIGVKTATSGFDDGMRYLLSCIVAGLAGGILNQLWFNYRPAMRLAYSTRLSGFGITYFSVLVACACFGNWLPAGNPWAWATFSIIFLAIFAVLNLVIGAGFKRSGIEYQKKLDDYHARRKDA